MVDDHDAREGSGPERPRVVGRDVVPVVAADGDTLCQHTFVHCSPSFLASLAGIRPAALYHAGRARNADLADRSSGYERS